MSTSITEDAGPTGHADDRAVLGNQPTLRSLGAAGVQTLGRYEVLGRIARGPVTIVYLVRARGEGGFERLFALKMLRKSLASDRAMARALLEEARIAGTISDPRVLGVVDTGFYREQPYVVMDYVHGGSFHDLLSRHPTYRPPRLIVPIVLDALGGLRAAHHLVRDAPRVIDLPSRDLSPRNLLVGLDGTCRMSRIGLAGGGLVSDVFWAGVILWNALTGQELVDASTYEDMLARLQTTPAPAPSSLGLAPPRCLDGVCLRALEHDVRARYRSAEDMIRDLHAVAMSAELLAPPSDVGRWVRETFGPELEARRLATGSAGQCGTADGSALASRADSCAATPEPVDLVTSAVQATA